MNQQERTTTRSPVRLDEILHWRDKSFKLSDAGRAAFNEKEAGNLQGALEIYDLMLTRASHSADLHNYRGIILRGMDRSEEALSSSDRAIALKPLQADGHINRGLALQKLNRHAEALVSFDRAIALKPLQVEGHINRGVSLQKLNRHAEALVSFDRAIELKPEYSLAALAHHNRGESLLAGKRYEEALASCDNAIALKPDFMVAHFSRGTALQILMRHDEALASYDKAIELKPDFAGAHLGRGLALKQLKRYDEALASYDKTIELKPDCAEAYHGRGLAMLVKGRMQEGEEMFHKALALKPDYAAPLSGLASIYKNLDADRLDIKTIENLVNNPALPAEDKEFLYFSLGKIHDDCGRHDEAFDYYKRGNQICNGRVCYSPEGVTARTNLIVEVFSRDFLAQPSAFASDSRSPLFIVGMPRSGTTLMASILSNHRSIATAGELPTIPHLASFTLPALTGTGILFPQAVKHITPAVAARLIRDYEERLRRDAGPDIPHVVDKYPLNFWNVGFISMLFPRARIIHCTRHPLDTGLSNYFQRFGPQYDYCFDLRNIGHYYAEYARLMEHWRQVLPQPMMEVDYQDTVLNTEQTVRKLLDFLGLEWDERCLAPHTNPAPVETASLWQVRQPIYNQSLERWRHYEKHLAPLKEVLAGAGLLPV